MSSQQTREQIGARIRALRTGRGMTIEALAAEAGEMSAVYLGNIERGADKNPTVRVLSQIAVALSVDLATLLDLYEGVPKMELRKLARRRINGLSEDELRRVLRVMDAIR